MAVNVLEKDSSTENVKTSSMFSIKIYNKISAIGLDRLDSKLYGISDDATSPNAIIVRSADLHNMELNPELLAVARAGAGYNNVPVDACTEKGIVVFNTPGANANAVKEMVLTGLLLSARDIIGGISYAKSISNKGSEIKSLVEKRKSQFKGIELRGKRLAVIGLGAIGQMVANDAVSLGMEVSGYDPFISIHHAWGLSRSVKRAENLKKLLSTADFITLHMPLTGETKQFIDREILGHVKKSAVLLNFSRAEIIQEDDVISALDEGQLGLYVSDFPTESLLTRENVICIPHLGASTKEAEDNCAIMAADQISDYLENGNIRNSVNFPKCVLEWTGEERLTIMNDNVPHMVSQITAILADSGLNIQEMVNKSQGAHAYTIVDVAGQIRDTTVTALRGIEGVSNIRHLRRSK